MSETGLLDMLKFLCEKAACGTLTERLFASVLISTMVIGSAMVLVGTYELIRGAR